MQHNNTKHINHNIKAIKDYRYGIVGFNVPLDTFRRRFYGSVKYDPTNSVIALKDNG